jgi:putative cell wall-binding protein
MNDIRTGASRHVVMGVVAGLVAVVGVAFAPLAAATTTVTTERVSGPDRYGTAQAIANHASMGTPTGAIVATGQNFPDALAASVLSGANGPQPIVLTETDAYTPEAKNSLAALKAKFAGLAVTIVGGTTAVSADVEAAIKADGFTVTRVGGTDRYDTANLIARAANARQAGGTLGGAKTALFATGADFPDALAAGPVAFRNDLPILLVTADALPAATKSAITVLGIKNAIIVGGSSVISPAVAAEIAAATGDVTVDRLAGGTRDGTAAAVMDLETAVLGYPMANVVLATGTNFPDALAAGPLAGVFGGAIVLTSASGISGESKASLDKSSRTISKLWVAGGTTVIDDATVADAKASAQNVGNDS